MKVERHNVKYRSKIDSVMNGDKLVTIARNTNSHAKW